MAAQCICSNVPSASVRATIETDSLWSETIDFSEKFIDTNYIDEVIETITESVKKTKTVCSDRKKLSCNETCNTACRCGKIARRKVCACKLFGVDKLCNTTCKTVTETYCKGVDTFEDIVYKTKIPVSTEFYTNLKGNININLYANTSISAGTDGGGAGIAIYLVIQMHITEVNVVGKLKVKGNHVGGFSISEKSLRKFEIPSIIVNARLRAGVDINKLSSYSSFWNFLDAEIAACVELKHLSLNYNLGGNKFTLGNPTINLCADPELRKIVLSVRGSIEHTFDKIENTNTTPKISTGFIIPIPLPIG